MKEKLIVEELLAVGWLWDCGAGEPSGLVETGGGTGVAGNSGVERNGVNGGGGGQKGGAAGVKGAIPVGATGGPTTQVPLLVLQTLGELQETVTEQA